MTRHVCENCGKDSQCPNLEKVIDSNPAFEMNAHNPDTLWEEIKEVANSAINSAYGTDARHMLLAKAVADKVAFGLEIPFNLARHFGRS